MAAFLRDRRKLQLATINSDGTPHMVTMFYATVDEKIVFWTYDKAQKTLNIARDPRITVLVEAGEEYNDLRGVMVYGKARLIDDPDEVLRVGMEITRSMTGMGAGDVEQVREYVAHTARKRVAFAVEPSRVVSWDHRKLP